MVLSWPRRGEIWWGEPPHQKSRPYLVLTRTTAVPVLHEILVATVTRKLRGIPSELRLGPEDGLATECAANFDNLTPIAPAYLVYRMTALGPDRMAEACVALRAAVDC